MASRKLTSNAQFNSITVQNDTTSNNIICEVKITTDQLESNSIGCKSLDIDAGILSLLNAASLSISSGGNISIVDGNIDAKRGYLDARKLIVGQATNIPNLTEAIPSKFYAGLYAEGPIRIGNQSGTLTHPNLTDKEIRFYNKVNMEDELEVDKAVSCKDGVQLNGAVQIGNNSTPTSPSLTVFCNSSFQGNLGLTSELTVAGTSNLNGEVKIAGSAFLNGVTEFAHEVKIMNNSNSILKVFSDAKFYKATKVYGNEFKVFYNDASDNATPVLNITNQTIGFFNKTPTAQINKSTATDIPGIIAALKAYGLLTT